MIFQHYPACTQEAEGPKDDKEKKQRKEKTEDSQDNSWNTFLQIWNLILIIPNLLIHFKEIKRRIAGHTEWQHKKTIS